MTDWWARQRSRMSVSRAWGYHINAPQMAAGYCLIAPWLHPEAPWLLVLVGLVLCVQTPSINYRIMGKADD
jgi:hypothetical protein